MALVVACTHRYVPFHVQPMAELPPLPLPCQTHTATHFHCRGQAGHVRAVLMAGLLDRNPRSSPANLSMGSTECVTMKLECRCGGSMMKTGGASPAQTRSAALRPRSSPTLIRRRRFRSCVTRRCGPPSHLSFLASPSLHFLPCSSFHASPSLHLLPCISFHAAPSLQLLPCIFFLAYPCIRSRPP